MRLVADENMPLLAGFFADVGEVVTLPGRHIRAADVREADALLVRSVTRVDRQLVEGSALRFIGTATIGTDHIDLPAMRDLGITVASAPGCNARAVGEYVATVLVSLAAGQGWSPEERTLGVVGLGNTGSWVARLARALGMRVLGCDPVVSLPDAEPRSLAELLAEANVVSLHVPLLRDGPHPTWHLLGRAELEALKPGAVLINSSRGEVVDNVALDALLAGGHPLTAVLDVWEGEPRIRPSLLAWVRWGSPHVAGYSQEGKWRGTESVYRAFCDRFSLPARHSLASLQPAPPLPAWPVPEGMTVAEALRLVLQRACPLPRDDAALRASLELPDPAAAFDELRRGYPPRREFTAHSLLIADDHPARPVLERLGFRLERPARRP